MLIGLVWGCHVIPVVPLLQRYYMNWSEAQDGNDSENGSLHFSNCPVPLRILVKGKHHLVPFS